MRSSKSLSEYIGSFLYRPVLIPARLLGTPDENTWPGVTSFPDFKATFPKWRRESTQKFAPTLDEAGLDLLDQLLEYDPSRRLSAKQACLHDYFTGGTAVYSQRTSAPTKTNGYH